MIKVYTETDLVSLLSKIRNNKFDVPTDIDPFILIKEVCRHLGSRDPVLRDELGYTLLAEWVYKRRILNQEQLQELYDMINSKNMWFYRIGENHTESVNMRSFSSLVITLLLLVDIDSKFLTIHEWNRLLNCTKDYCRLEIDLRGFSEQDGWLHAGAHVADVLNAFVKHPNFSQQHATDILLAINHLMENAKEVFQYEEDERLSRTIVNLVQNEYLSIEELVNWFESSNINLETYVLRMRKRINWKLLFRSCFSQLEERKLFNYEKHMPILIGVKEKLDPGSL